MRREVERTDELPEHYGTVAEDLIAFCGSGGNVLTSVDVARQLSKPRRDRA